MSDLDGRTKETIAEKRVARDDEKKKLEGDDTWNERTRKLKSSASLRPGLAMPPKMPWLRPVSHYAMQTDWSGLKKVSKPGRSSYPKANSTKLEAFALEIVSLSYL